MFETFEIRKYIDHGEVITKATQAFTFPGGEAHVVLKPTSSIQIAWVRGADGNDLMKLAMWADAVKRHGLQSIVLLPYLPGARQDRGIPLGAKVYADFINSLKLDHVVALDPHSDVAPALYDNLTVVPPTEVMPWRLEVAGIIVPDLGARKRAEAAAQKYNLPIYQASKHRDFATGKLSGFSCEPLPEEGNFLVVDDICDGGGTFLGLADVLKLPKERLQLWVTHGIFSQGLERLSESYGLIYTTDSHSGVDRYLKLDSADREWAKGKLNVNFVLHTLVNSVKGIRL